MSISLPTISKFDRHPDICFTMDDWNTGNYKARYVLNYPAMFERIKQKPEIARAAFREACKKDLFFIVYFVMGIPIANHPFIVNRCRMVEENKDSMTVDIWARGHLKSSIITIGYTIQRILNNPECTTAIFSFKKPAADKFLDSIRNVLAMPFMYWVFPDILYDKPATQAHVWSLQGGIRVKRQSEARKENTVEAFGLIEGMPTGGHFDHRIYDDVETADLALNPEQLQLCFERLEMSRNLGTDGGTEQIIGTYYSHCGVMVKLGDKLNHKGEKMYTMRIFPATEDGTIDGKPVFLSQEGLDSLKTDSTFNSQQLCNPSPIANIKLHYDRFIEIHKDDLPEERYKFIIIDPAGDKAVQSGNKTDSWAMLCVSVEMNKMDELGNSNIYIEDMITGKFELSEAISAACNLYIRNGRIAMLGIEKVANDTTYEHVANALKSRGVYLNMKTKGKFGGNFMLLSPMGKTKNYRIESALAWPLNNSKIHLVSTLDIKHKVQLEEECNKFPFFHVDILDALAYVYQILADPTFDNVIERKKKVKDVGSILEQYNYQGAW